MAPANKNHIAFHFIVVCAIISSAFAIDSSLTPHRSSKSKSAEVIVSVPVDSLELTVTNEEEPFLNTEDYIWLARCIYSETKRPHEQKLVAWVVRNRLETKYRGKRTYKDVILDPFQFSAFNPGYKDYDLYVRLNESSNLTGWRTAQKIAKEVMKADSGQRPFPINTRHFYSEVSMINGLSPHWTEDQKPIEIPNAEIPEERFRFYAGVI